MSTRSKKKNELIKFSASDIVKITALQILFLHKRASDHTRDFYSRVTREYKERGNKYAEKLSKGHLQEMRGIYKGENYLLFFCIDKIDIKKGIAEEIKMIYDHENVQQWYLNQSLMQSYFYNYLLKHVDKLVTASFRVKEGHKLNRLIDPNYIIKRYRLNFGGRIYEIYLNDDRLYRHYLEKCKFLVNILNRPWHIASDLAREWDNKYKWNEFELFKNSIRYTRIK